MLKTLSIILTLMIILPLTSAIYVGEAYSEPTRITFSIGEPNTNDPNDDDNDRRDRPNPRDLQRIADDAYESELRQTTYGDWYCINNQLRRSVSTLDHTNYEYGQSCGYVIEQYPNQNGILIFWSLTIFLGILIIITLISIMVTVAGKNI